MKSLADSPRYTEFVRERDRALEEMLRTFHLKVSDVLRRTLTNVVMTCEALYARVERADFDIVTYKHTMQTLDQQIENEFMSFTLATSRMLQKARKDWVVLAYSGESEAIARGLARQTKHVLTKRQIELLTNQDTALGTDISKRIDFNMSKLKRKILNAAQQSMVQSLETKQAVAKILKVLPETKEFGERPKKVLKDVKAKESAQEFSISQIDDDDWNSMIDAYKEEYVPQWRGPDSVVGGKAHAKPPLNEYYAWELEQEITDDFVNQVRSGQVEAANKEGIKDFIWISVVDDRTDECCLWRDGLTTKEIEDQLKTTHADDECDAVTPPAHFNCRCTLAPATEDLPDEPPPRIGDFDDWLNE